MKKLTPEEFAERMKEIKETAFEEEEVHGAMDDLMCELLIALGYREGVKIFKNTPKWYA